MHITKKISLEMKKTFISTECSHIQKIEYTSNAEASQKINLLLTFIYEQGNYQLTLRFINVTMCYRERDSVSFICGELLFYDDEDGTPLHVGDELGSFSLVCDDVEFVILKDNDQQWVREIDDLRL